MGLILHPKSTELQLFFVQRRRKIHSKDTFQIFRDIDWLLYCLGCKTSKSTKFYKAWLFIVHLCYIATEKHRAELPFILGGNSIHLAVLEKDKWTTMWNGALRWNLLPSCPEWTSWLILPWLKALKWNLALCLREVRRQSPTIQRSHCFITPWRVSTIFIETPEPLGILQFTHSLKM